MMKHTRKSIVQDDISVCFLCGRNGASDRLEKHHIFGAANRNHSEEDGLFVFLCGNRCHRNGKVSAHQNAVTTEALHKIGQHAYEKQIGNREKFMNRYGKNYLEEEKEFSEYMNKPEEETNHE